MQIKARYKARPMVAGTHLSQDSVGVLGERQAADVQIDVRVLRRAVGVDKPVGGRWNGVDGEVEIEIEIGGAVVAHLDSTKALRVAEADRQRLGDFDCARSENGHAIDLRAARSRQAYLIGAIVLLLPFSSLSD